MTTAQLATKLVSICCFDRVKHPNAATWYFYKKGRLRQYPFVIRVSDHPPSNNGVDIDFTGKYWSKKEARDIIETVKVKVKALDVFGT